MTPMQAEAHVRGWRRPPTRWHAWVMAIAFGLAVAAYASWRGL